MKINIKMMLAGLIALAIVLTFVGLAPIQTPGLIAGGLPGALISAAPALSTAATDHLAASPQQTPDGDKLVVGGSYLLESGDRLDGNLIVLGGSAMLAEESTVNGDVVVLGGTINVEGNIRGDLNIIAGLGALGSAAQVSGDVNSVFTQLSRAEGAQISGNFNAAPMGPFSLIVPGTFRIPNWEGAPSLTLPRTTPAPVIDIGLNPIWDAMWWFFRSLVWAALAVIVALFSATSMRRVADTAVKQFVPSAGLGCLTILIAPLVLVLLAITICGLPISLIGAFALWMAWVFGVIALGSEIGERLAGLLKVDWAAPVAAGAGTFTLTLLMNGIGGIVPCVGWLAPLLVGLIGLGAVVLTRFGAQPYPAQELAFVGDEALPLPSAESPVQPGEPPIEG